MSALLLLRAVPASGLLAVADALSVQGAADDLVADAGKVPDPAAPHQHDGVLLQVVADTGDVGGDLDVTGQPDPRRLAQRRVRLPRGGRVDARADSAALRASLERRGLALGGLVLPTLADQLLDRGHRVSVFLRAPERFFARRGVPDRPFLARGGPFRAKTAPDSGRFRAVTDLPDRRVSSRPPTPGAGCAGTPPTARPPPRRPD